MAGRSAAIEEQLREQPLFAAFSDEDLARLAARTEEMDLEPGAVLMAEGDPGDALFAIVEGEFEVSKASGTDEVPVGAVGPREVVGEMSLLEGAPRMASVRARTPAHVLRISRAAFMDLVTSRPSAAVALLGTVTRRLRSTEAMLRQREKLAGLGTLAAGLAHELNNPAAAALRSATLLATRSGEWDIAAAALGAAGLDELGAEIVDALRDELPARATAPPVLSPLEAADRIEAVEALLASETVDDRTELAPALVALGWDANALDDLAAQFSDPHSRAAFLAWLGSSAALHALIAEVTTAAGRISEIVRAVKTYTFLDQAPILTVDLHEGLENTLVILRHKLKAGIAVIRDYAPDLPRIEAYGSELNQVWTNIIDNAIDAMGVSGELHIRTAPAEDNVLVELCDDGPGISAEVQARIFEPFFTTKEPGVGTGLGLHIAYNIVVQRHHGTIAVESRPGRTCFRVTLPLAQPRT